MSSVQSSADFDRFRAANGSKVSMKAIAKMSLGFSLMDVNTGKKAWKIATECHGREHPTQHLVDNSLVQI